MADIKDFSRKYRPTSFKEYVGNKKAVDNILTQLQNNTNDRPQVILIEGDSGCGKTTLARLIAKEYRCENRDITKGACCTCASCTAIDDYIKTGSTDMLIGIHELNIAETSGKNDINEIFQEMDLPTFSGDWRIYIFDECHKASDALQNRLLKLAEEPPENILIIFCTTNVEKMTPALLNRCRIKLHITRPNMNELVALLKAVCKAEDIEYDLHGLELIARHSDYVVRSALNLLQQVVKEHEVATTDCVEKTLDYVANSVLVNFFKALRNKDVLQYMTILSKVKRKMDLTEFVFELRKYVTKGIYALNGIDIDGVSLEEINTYKKIFGGLGLEEIANIISKLLRITNNNNDLEMELLLWGYTGLKSADKKESSELVETVVAPIIESNELALETKNIEKMDKEKKEEEKELSHKAVEDLTQPVDLAYILNMGGVVVD